MPEPGSVHALAPLTVQLDSSTTPQPAVNMTSVTLVVADRVDVEQIGKQLHVLGVDRSGVPTGTSMIWWTATAPAGWMIIDGIPKSRTTYAGLFALWGTSFGAGDGSTTFGIPGTPGRTVVGQDPAQTEFDVLGETGGEKTHLLTTAEIPSHNHTQDAHGHSVSDSGHSHAQYVTAGTSGSGSRIDYNADGASSAYPQGVNTGTNTTGVSVGSTTAVNQVTGGGAVHNNLSPYIVAVYIVKT